MGPFIAILLFGFIIYYFVKRSKRKEQELIKRLEDIVRESKQQNPTPPQIDEELYKAQVREETQDRINSGNLRDYEEDDAFDIFNDPRIETEAKSNRNNPIIITFIYEKHDEDGNVIGTQERAIQPYYKDDEYLEGYCLDREERRTFRIDKIARFTGNSEAIFEELD